MSLPVLPPAHPISKTTMHRLPSLAVAHAFLITFFSNSTFPLRMHTIVFAVHGWDPQFPVLQSSMLPGPQCPQSARGTAAATIVAPPLKIPDVIVHIV